MKNRLQRLLKPTSVAVVGGGAWCEAVLEGMLKGRFAGPVWAVHPTRSRIAGHDTISRVEDLPDPPDAVFVGVNRHTTIDVVRALSNMGAGGVVCFASGFSELGDNTGEGLSAALLAAAGDMPVLGPNCYGLINALDGAALWPDIHGLTPVESGVAIVTQSSNIALNLTMQKRGLPIAYVATAGNQLQTSLAELGSALLAEDRVTALGLHVEGFGDVAAFEALAETARTLGKRIVALKVGRSDMSRAAALSHTASLAGSDAGAGALMKRLGIARAETLEGLLEALKILHLCGPLPSASLASMSCSGGEASLIADAGTKAGVTFPPIGDDQLATLRAILGPMVALTNPLDYHTFVWGDLDGMKAAFSAMMATEAALTAVVVDFPRADRCDAPQWRVLEEAAIAANAATSGPLALWASLPETMPEDVSARLMHAGILPLCGIEAALEGVRLAACPAVALRPAIWNAPCESEGVLVNEPAAKITLAEYGVTVPPGALVAAVSEVCSVATRLEPPLVVKAVGVAHKSETGGVRLNVARHEVEKVAQTMGPGPFLIEEMAQDGIELLLGVVADPAHGYVLTLGAGGVLTEVLGDIASVLLPTSRTEVLEALGQLRVSARFAGYRGKPGCDLEAVWTVVEGVQRYINASRGEVLELEINPLIASESGAVAADALIKVKSELPQSFK